MPTRGETFVTIYAPLVHRFGRRQGLQDADAADLTQDVLGEVCRAIRSFEYQPARGRFRDWLLVITRRRSARFQERRARNQEKVVEASKSSRGSKTTASVADWNDAFHARVLRVALERIQPSFHPQTWRAFECVWLENRSAAETANALSLGIDAVYTAKSRVLKRLAEEVEEIAAGFSWLDAWNRLESWRIDRVAGDAIAVRDWTVRPSPNKYVRGRQTWRTAFRSKRSGAGWRMSCHRLSRRRGHSCQRLCRLPVAARCRNRQSHAAELARNRSGRPDRRVDLAITEKLLSEQGDPASRRCRPVAREASSQRSQRHAVSRNQRPTSAASGRSGCWTSWAAGAWGSSIAPGMSHCAGWSRSRCYGRSMPGQPTACGWSARRSLRLDFRTITRSRSTRWSTRRTVCPYLVMEYVNGPTLAELISSGRRPTPRQLAVMVAQAAHGRRCGPCGRACPPRRQAEQHPDRHGDRARQDHGFRRGPHPGGARRRSRAKGSWPALRPT